MAETTSSSFPPLSNRTQQALKRGADSPLSTALFKTFGNQWTSENPDGVVNAGLAENSLMHECSFSLSIPPPDPASPNLRSILHFKGLQEFWARTGIMKLEHTVSSAFFVQIPITFHLRRYFLSCRSLR